MNNITKITRLARLIFTQLPSKSMTQVAAKITTRVALDIDINRFYTRTIHYAKFVISEMALLSLRTKYDAKHSRLILVKTIDSATYTRSDRNLKFAIKQF